MCDIEQNPNPNATLRNKIEVKKKHPSVQHVNEKLGACLVINCFICQACL